MSREQRRTVNQLLRTPQTQATPAPPTETQPPSAARAIAAQRVAFADMMAGMRVPENIRTTPTVLAERPALLVEPEGHGRSGTILYLHGGGNVVGSPETALGLTGELVARTGIRALSLDYRLAPEHPYPAGLGDTVAAYHSLLNAGISAESIVFAGDSAGGGLAVSACLLARDEGLPVPAAVVAFSPGLDYTRTGASIEGKAHLDPMFSRDSLRVTATHYLAGQDAAQELVSPAVYADLTDFPPLLLQVGTNELLLDDSTRMAARARDAGVDVILDVTADVPHVFQSFVGMLDESDRALARAALFLTQHCR